MKKLALVLLLLSGAQQTLPKSILSAISDTAIGTAIFFAGSKLGNKIINNSYERFTYLYQETPKTYCWKNSFQRHAPMRRHLYGISVLTLAATATAHYLAQDGDDDSKDGKAKNLFKKSSKHAPYFLLAVGFTCANKGFYLRPNQV